MNHCRIGIDLGGTNIAAGLVLNETIIDTLSCLTRAPRRPQEIIADMAQLCHALLEKNRIAREQVLSLGVGIPGTANQQNGHVEDADNLGWQDEPFLTLLAEAVPWPVHFENDANAAALGEYRHSGCRAPSFIMVTLGTGVGGGIILNGRIQPGINGAAGEFGHMVIRRGGRACNCGRHGCLEAYASAPALKKQAAACMKKHSQSLLWEKASPATVDARLVFDVANEGDALALGLVEWYTDHLAEGLANIINLLQPAVMCIGGGVCHAGDTLFVPLEKKIDQMNYARHALKKTRLIRAALGNDAGILGAALLGNE